MWRKVAGVMVNIDTELKAEHMQEDSLPNKWRRLMVSQQIQVLRKAAEKYFRKALKKQQKITVWEISDESSEDIEIISVKQDTAERRPFEGTFVPNADDAIPRSLHPSI